MEMSEIYGELNEIKWIIESELESNPKLKNNQPLEDVINRIEALQEKI